MAKSTAHKEKQITIANWLADMFGGEEFGSPVYLPEADDLMKFLKAHEFVVLRDIKEASFVEFAQWLMESGYLAEPYSDDDQVSNNPDALVRKFRSEQ